MARILGIDVGINGGAAIFDGSFAVDIIDLPTVGEGPQRIIDALTLSAWIKENRPDYAFIELVTAMPSIPGQDGVRRGMGAASAFRFGNAAGSIRATVALCLVPYRMIVPVAWKKYYGLKGPNKEQSRLMAISRFPAAARFMERMKDHQRAEALLIAAYGSFVVTRGQETEPNRKPAAQLALM